MNSTVLAPRDRVAVVIIHGQVFHHLLNKKIRITGLPSYVEFVKMWVDQARDLLYLMYRHPSFEERLVGCDVVPQSLIVTTYEEEPEP